MKQFILSAICIYFAYKRSTIGIFITLSISIKFYITDDGNDKIIRFYLLQVSENKR
jgi:hypothetical protein